MNTIRIESYERDAFWSDGMRMPHTSWTFWRVFVDGQLISSEARPFSCSEPEIVLQECELCYQCGTPSVSSRRALGNVVWFNSALAHSIDAARLSGAYVFDGDQYCTAIGGGDYHSLRVMDASDIGVFLQGVQTFDPSLGLYTIPEIGDDSQGRLALSCIARLVRDERSRLRASDAAHSGPEFRIGIDLRGVPECVFRVDTSSGSLAVLLVEHPNVPVWLTGESVEAVLGDYVRRLLLNS